MRRWVKIVLFAVLLPLMLIGGSATFALIRLRGSSKAPRTAKVERGDVVVGVRETGFVEPKKRVEVKSKVAGMLAELVVEEGDRVEEGQLIARLDVPELEAQRDQIRAQLDAARERSRQARLSHSLDSELIASQLQQAESNLRAAQHGASEAEARHRDAERIYETKRRLFENGGYVSQNEVDSAKAAREVAAQAWQSAKERVEQQRAALAIAKARRTDVQVSQSRVSEAEASVRQIEDSLTEIETRLRESLIRAPCAGVVIARHVREGELITAVSYYGAGAPIVSIGDLSTMLVKVNLNEVDVSKVKLGQSVTITADALPDRTFEGRVTRISPASAGEVRESGIVRFPVEVTVLGDSADLKPGMTANVEIVGERADDVLWVPNDALFEKDGEWFVTVVTGEKKGRPITKDRKVTKGLATDSRTEIRSGLKEGEEVQLGKAEIPERKKIDIEKEARGKGA